MGGSTSLLRQPFFPTMSFSFGALPISPTKLSPVGVRPTSPTNTHLRQPIPPTIVLCSYLRQNISISPTIQLYPYLRQNVPVSPTIKLCNCLKLKKWKVKPLLECLCLVFLIAALLWVPLFTAIFPRLLCHFLNMFVSLFPYFPDFPAIFLTRVII